LTPSNTCLGYIISRRYLVGCRAIHIHISTDFKSCHINLQVSLDNFLKIHSNQSHMYKKYIFFLFSFLLCHFHALEARFYCLQFPQEFNDLLKNQRKINPDFKGESYEKPMEECVYWCGRKVELNKFLVEEVKSYCFDNHIRDLTNCPQLTCYYRVMQERKTPFKKSDFEGIEKTLKFFLQKVIGTYLYELALAKANPNEASVQLSEDQHEEHIAFLSYFGVSSEIEFEIPKAASIEAYAQEHAEEYLKRLGKIFVPVKCDGCTVM